ncbi:putative target SNARE coiled-coil domain, syntaxin domain, syntaxin/epimorphin [Helianthus annuus]|nr:putative target SNARE coiled-coil domain, syntaxin domain, syntaxin/epimorphin [Helianthus annuus]KAJ0687011.1 putative target SNARE coiled-coil domain, syntaxin domain, syntaxin/epimorphin [Helianthus annuus]KAJ0690815.1 putative target SNARE coiled-coil domain, syntaxin domain, syntaxin/epimorphin [Helianthus annuus]KAJ0872457.1 putative target SNARE coiled-coil domain, syntaxin domain, syntaxin/epimorphin [Helianthus annuus]
MNDLLSRSFSGGRTGDIEMGNTGDTAGTNLERFFHEVDAIKEELKALEMLHKQLQSSNEQSKTLHSANSIKTLKTKMDNDVALSLKKAKLIKTGLEALDRSNETNRSLPGCGPGSSTDRTRTSVVNGVRNQLKVFMKSFNELREKMAAEHRETVQRRYYTVTGENADESTLEKLISTGESETFLQKAIQEQGRGQVMETVLEIQERHDAVTVIERNLKELHQVFMDMAVLVEHQGEQLDDIETHVNRANSFVTRGAAQLNEARKKQKNTRKWTCFGILLLLIIIAIIVLSIRPWK